MFTVMKLHAVIASVVLAACLRVSAQGLLLNTGDVYTYELNSFAFCCGGGLGPPEAALALGVTSLASGSTLLFEAFENSLSETPIFTSADLLPDGYSIYRANLGLAWQDLQGAFKVTMTSGSASLHHLHGTVQTPDTAFYIKSVTIPEPSTVNLCALGAALCLLAMRKGWICRNGRRTAPPAGPWLAWKVSRR